MERLKYYLAYLLIPATPYLLMIYSPETVDPFYQYLCCGKGHKLIWIVMISVLLVSLNFAIVSDAKACDVPVKRIGFTKWYLLIVAILVSIYILYFNSASFKNALFGVSITVVVFYLYLINIGKKKS